MDERTNEPTNRIAGISVQFTKCPDCGAHNSLAPNDDPHVRLCEECGGTNVEWWIDEYGGDVTGPY
jgi:hypothetical protein